MQDLFSVKGKSALVTGSNRGIGLMIARALSEAGARVMISGRDATLCQQVCEELNNSGGNCTAIPADLSNEQGVMSLAEAVNERESTLDILINNAAIHRMTPLASARFADVTELMNTNVASLLILTQQLLPLLTASASVEDPARIINMSSSLIAENNHWDSYVYAASKAAIGQISRDMANDLADRHITVNYMAPSSFPSRMVDQYLDEDYTLENVAEHLPLKRVGKPSDMAGLVLYLCSEAGSFITGNCIHIDGGVSIR